MASGPSLTADDCETVRAWREEEAGRGVIVTNTTFRLCPWADVLYAMDAAWWRVHGEEAANAFGGELCAPLTFPGVKRIRFHHFQNSGAGAASLASFWGARRIILLGYDCQKTGGRAHWHGDHPAVLGNAGSVDKWPAQFRQLADHLAGLDVINCSRETALEAFPRRPLEEVLS
ncbi:TPA: hypothetical protein L4747_005160 [Pseudomonas aeruginosa]|nr:hypothetical protein [Pseudomonas aeruginosa]RQB11461.1 hypothetical protein IPC470_03760 [Pseudomonas aeruginosa]RTX13591.1 hypothetical protein DZA18_19215 [Pseudomonas aeruginosa]HBO5821564.1 hypothetical protein [Pseudomonas aeruginosa]HBO6335726.1 hypothetical protein [Pseudomonas aeruginosa]